MHALQLATHLPSHPPATPTPKKPRPQVMKKAFDEGWGGVICKTLSLDAAKVVNVTPRYAKLRDGSGAVFGWENIELISDRWGGPGRGGRGGGGGFGWRSWGRERQQQPPAAAGGE
jgi:hypothetical protein